jgi:hypothetical protein
VALVTKVEVKALLRRPAGETAEDTLIDGWIAQAKALIQQDVGVPIVGVSRAWTDRAVTQRTDYSPRTLQLPYPMDISTLVVKDGDLNTLVVTTDYDTSEVNTSGLLHAARGCSFTNGPYSGTATIGLDKGPDYALIVEPILNNIILDVVSEWYQNRRPGAASENDPGVGVTNLPDSLPPRVARQLRSISPTLA